MEQAHGAPNFSVDNDPSWYHYPETVLYFTEFGLVVDLREPVSASAAATLSDAFGIDPVLYVLTASNPRGLNSSDADNCKMNNILQQDLQSNGGYMTACIGKSPDGQHAEPGWAIQTSEALARSLAQKFKQTAFFGYTSERFILYATDARVPKRVLP